MKTIKFQSTIYLLLAFLIFSPLAYGSVLSSEPKYVTREQAIEDISELVARLEDQFAYLHLRGVNWREKFDAISQSLPERVMTGTLAKDLHRVMVLFGDGHARIKSKHMRRPRLYPPFMVDHSNAGFIAIRADRSGFFDDEHPFILAIDGKPIDEWLQAVRPRGRGGSEQWVRYISLMLLQHLELLREDLQMPQSDTIQCTLASNASNSKTVEVTFQMTNDSPLDEYFLWPRRDTGILNGNIGYLRIPLMDHDAVPNLQKAMEEFRDTQGLIVDVRGNGGGSRSLLLALAGYLIGSDDQPWVGNTAKYKLSDRFDHDHLEVRYMYRGDDERWTDDQRVVINAFAQRFEPEWEPVGNFSAWHYLLLDKTHHKSEYFYDKPIIVLCNAGCFSATDIFLGALAVHPRVSLMGSPSGGGSARSQRFDLTHSDINVKCASMASFRPDGRLYDGRGVEVDVEIHVQPTDLIEGGTDSVLDAALATFQ